MNNYNPLEKILHKFALSSKLIREVSFDLETSIVTSKNQKVLENFIVSRNSILPKRIYLFIKAGIHRQTYLGNLGLFCALILKKI